MIFAFHDYPAIIHKPTYRRRNHDNIHVRGYKEEGTTSTPFDREVLNNMDRYQLALDAIRRIVIGGSRAARRSAPHPPASACRQRCQHGTGDHQPPGRD